MLYKWLYKSRFIFNSLCPAVDRLSQKDKVILLALTEKLQLFADMAESVAGLEDTASRSRLLLRGDASDLQQGETLLKGAITEGMCMPQTISIYCGHKACQDGTEGIVHIFMFLDAAV